MIYGLLNLHKPTTWTSRDVVNRIENQVRGVKVGHAGTLDPLATGVLVVCVGPATRLVPYIQDQAKTYRATFLWGQRSPSDDTESEIEVISGLPAVTDEQLHQTIPQFVGCIRQIPPAFSAIKVDGQRAYKKARKGRPVEIPEREVQVDRITLLSNDHESFSLEIVCGGGTYVRSIGRDIARACGSAAIMSALCRTRVGEFTVEQALDPESLHRRNIIEHLISPLRAIPEYPQVVMSEVDIQRLLHGNPVFQEYPVYTGPVAVCNAAGELVCLGEYDAKTQRYWPKIALREPRPVPRLVAESVSPVE